MTAAAEQQFDTLLVTALQALASGQTGAAKDAIDNLVSTLEARTGKTFDELFGAAA